MPCSTVVRTISVTNSFSIGTNASPNCGEMFLASKCENILISSEHFSYATTEDEWRKIHEAFSPLADTLKIVIYLRRQDTMAEANWGHV